MLAMVQFVTLYRWPAKQMIFGPEISPYPEVVRGTKESWLEKGAGRQLAWKHGQMRSTPETVAEKIGSSEED